MSNWYDGLAGGVATGLVGGIANAWSQNQANKAQQRMFDESMKFQKYQYEDMKNYNSAAAQVSRLRAAGLNPALAMANGTNAGQASAVSSPSPASQGAVDYAGALNAGTDVYNAVQQGELIQSQKQDLEQDVQGKKIDNAFKEADWMAKLANMKMSTSYTEQLKNMLAQDLKLKMATYDYDVKKSMMESQLAEAKAQAQFITNQYLPQQLQEQINQSIAQQAYLYMTGKASLQQAHAAIMQATNQANAFDAQFGGNPADRSKFFTASLRYLIQQKETAASQEWRNTKFPFAGEFGGFYGHVSTSTIQGFDNDYQNWLNTKNGKEGNKQEYYMGKDGKYHRLQ